MRTPTSILWDGPPFAQRWDSRRRLIEFPVPATELAASFHFEISAPPEVSIARAALLAGRPKPEPKLTNITPRASGDDRSSRAGMKNRRRRRPSFDSIGGGCPTVDLHVAEVPYGSRSRAHLEVEARVGSWFATAVFSSWLATGILLFAWLVRPELAVGSALLMSFSSGHRPYVSSGVVDCEPRLDRAHLVLLAPRRAPVSP